MFQEVACSRGTRRSFAVTCGLQEGYGETAKKHLVEEGVQIALGWMKGRAAAGQPYLTGTISTGETVYAWPEGEGKAGGGHESTIAFTGEVSPLYNAAMTNEEAIAILNNLAATLGVALGQTRVYVAYCGEIWILQAEDKPTPTGN